MDFPGNDSNRFDRPTIMSYVQRQQYENVQPNKFF
jgi:hypothetical protein